MEREEKEKKVYIKFVRLQLLSGLSNPSPTHTLIVYRKPLRERRSEGKEERTSLNLSRSE